MSSKSAVSESARRLDDMKNAQELQLRQDGIALSAPLQQMVPMKQLEEQVTIGHQEMIAWFVPMSSFRPGALTYSEMSCADPDQRALKICHAFLLAMVSQPAMGRVTGKLTMGTMNVGTRAIDSRGVTNDGVEDTYNRFKTVAIWLTRGAVDANQGPREILRRRQKMTAEAALRQLPHRFAPEPMTRDNVVGALFISVLRDPEATYMRALEMTIRENQFLKNVFTVQERCLQNIRGLCEKVHDAGVGVGMTESEMFSLLFHPETQRPAALDAVAAAIDNVVNARAKEKVDKWLAAQEAIAQKMDERRDRGEKDKVDESELEDTSPAARAAKHVEFARKIRATLDLKSIPLWRVVNELGYCPDMPNVSVDAPSPLTSQQRLLRDVLISSTVRRLPTEISLSEQPGFNPAETGAHARVFIASFTEYVDFVLQMAGISMSERQRSAANRADSMSTQYAVRIDPVLDPARHLTLARALDNARAAGAHPDLLHLSNFTSSDGVLFSADLRQEHVKQPMTGPFSVPRVIMSRRPGTDANAVPTSADINVMAEGAHPISDNQGTFKLELRWPDHTTVFAAGKEMFEDNEDAQFPHTVDDFPARLEAAIDEATIKAANISQATVDRAQRQIVDNLTTSYRMLVMGDRDMMIDNPADIDQMRQQSFNLSIQSMASETGNHMTDREFFEKFSNILQCGSAELEAVMEAEVFSRGVIPRSAGAMTRQRHANVAPDARVPTKEELRILSHLSYEPILENIRKTASYRRLASFGDDTQNLRQQDGDVKRSSTHQLFYKLAPLIESTRILMVLEPETWRKMVADQRRYCLDQFARVYYRAQASNGNALRALAKWEACCYSGVSLGPQRVGAGMSMFGSFMATALSYASDVGGIINSPSIALDLLIMRGDVFRMSSQMSVHPMLVGPAALGKTSLCERVTRDWSIPATHSTTGSASSKANKDLGALRMAFSVRVMDEPPYCLTHGTKMDTGRDADDEFNSIKRLLGDSKITYERSLQGHGTHQIDINVRTSQWATANEFHFPKENSLMSRLWPTFCDSGDSQGLDNVLIMRTMQPAGIKSNTASSALRSQWRHHQHFVALMTQIGDCGGCIRPGVELLSTLTSMVFQRVGALIPGALSYPRLGGMAYALAVQHAQTRAFNVYCRAEEDNLHAQWRDGMKVVGSDDTEDEDDGDNDDDPMESDSNSDSSPSSRSANGHDGDKIDWVKTVGQEGKHIRRQFDISIINKMSPYSMLTSESAMFVITQMIDRIFPVHLHAVLFTLAVARGNWAPGALNFLLGSQNRDNNMSPFNDAKSAGTTSCLSLAPVIDPKTNEVISSRYVLSTFARTREAFGRTKMPMFWTREEEYENTINNNEGNNRNGLLEYIKFSSRDTVIDPNFVDISFHHTGISTFLRSAMANTQNPTDQMIRYILSYCQYGQSHIYVPSLERISVGGGADKFSLRPEDVKFATQPSPLNVGVTDAVMHSIPAVQVVGSGQDRMLRISTLYLMLGAERYRLMNMYAMLEDDFMTQDSRMLIARTVPGQSNLFQTIRMNRRPDHYLAAVNLSGSGVVGTNGSVSLSALNMPVDMRAQLPSGMDIRKALAPTVTSMLNTRVIEEISQRLNNWGYVEPIGPRETRYDYLQRNAVSLANCNSPLIVFNMRSIEDDCALAHLQMEGLTYAEALPYLPSRMQQQSFNRNAMTMSFSLGSGVSSGCSLGDDESDRADTTIIDIGTPDAPFKTNIADMRSMMTYFSNSGRLLYPDHYIKSEKAKFNPITTEVVHSTLGEMATEQFQRGKGEAEKGAGEPRRKTNKAGSRAVIRSDEEMRQRSLTRSSSYAVSSRQMRAARSDDDDGGDDYPDDVDYDNRQTAAMLSADGTDDNGFMII